MECGSLRGRVRSRLAATPGEEVEVRPTFERFGVAILWAGSCMAMPELARAQMANPVSLDIAARDAFRSPSDTTAEVGPSYSKTLAGTLGGGLAGAAVVGGLGGLVGETLDDGSGLVSLGYAYFVLAAPVGYWLGQAIGASWGASGPGHDVTTRELLLPAALWTGAGLAIYGLIGDAFDPEDGRGVDRTSWYVGAALGAALQITGMSLTAYRAGKKKASSTDPVSTRETASHAEGRSRTLSSVSFRLAPSPGGRLALVGRIRMGW